MNYHLEHHMYAAVPFHNLSKLRKAIEKDLPPAYPNLISAWKEILFAQKKQKTDPNFVLVPQLPNTND